MADLIVMRLVDMHRVHPRQDNSRLCTLCREQVGIFPSGQAILRDYPNARLVCHVCAVDIDYRKAALAPGAVKERSETRERKTH